MPDQAKLAREAQWCWPASCIGVLWGLGVVLSWVAVFYSGVWY